MPFVIYAMTSPTSGNGVALCVAPLAVLIPHGTVGQLMDLVTAVSTRPPALLHSDGTVLVHSGFDWFGSGDDLGHAGGHHECDDARLTDRGTGIGALAQYRARGLFAGLLDRADGQVQPLDLIAGFLNGLAGQARDRALLARRSPRRRAGCRQQRRWPRSCRTWASWSRADPYPSGSARHPRPPCSSSRGS